MSKSENHNSPAKGYLYITATPIGNLEDISARAITTLQDVDLIAAEDTRHSRVLLQHLGIDTPLIALHEHNEAERAGELLDRIEAGEKIAIISDAGTPLISDPGYRIVSEAHERGIAVVPVPGASAVTAAISVSGLPTDRFVFEGFLAAKQGARIKQLQGLHNETRTIIFYETGRRMMDCLKDMCDVFGGDRLITVCKELTKHFETIKRMPLDQSLAWFEEDPLRLKGEFVLMLGGCDKSELLNVSLQQARKAVELLAPHLPAKQAAGIVTELYEIPRNQAYQMVLDNKKQ